MTTLAGSRGKRGPVISSSHEDQQRAWSPVSRRTFLAGLGAASIVAVAAGCKPVPVPVPLPPGTKPPTSPTTSTTTTTEPAPIPSDPFVRSAWTPLVGQSVTLIGASGTITAVLDAVTDVGAVAGDERAFALGFRAPTSPVGLDQVDAVQTPSSGRRTITAMPIDRGSKHRWYEAVVYNPR